MKEKTYTSEEVFGRVSRRLSSKMKGTQPFNLRSAPPKSSTPEEGSTTLPYPTTLEARRERIRGLAEHLKASLFGIDEVIDRVVTSIRSWYLFPESVSRHQVVCLWGMTGVGKTALVRMLRDYLGFNSSYHEILMEDRDSCNDVCDACSSNHRIGDGSPMILLVDEFQRGRTKDSHGESKGGRPYQDLWQILSDGKVTDTMEVRTVYRAMSSAGWSPLLGFRGDVKVTDSDEAGETLSDPEVAVAMYESVLGYRLGDDTDKALKALPKDLYEIEVLAQRLRSLDRAASSRGFTNDGTLVSLLQAAHSMVFSLQGAQQLTTSKDFTRCLVFILGNLDELYEDAVGSLPSTAPADYVRERSLAGVTVASIQEVLSKMYFPEQVARLGSTHIAYPTIGEKGFRDITDAVMGAHAGKIVASGLISNLDRSVYELAFRNGVSPARGVRPLFSTITEVMSEVASVALLWRDSFGEDRRAPFVRYDEESLSFVAGAGPGKTTLRYVGQRDAILVPLRASSDYLKEIAYHEAGHVVAWYVLSGGIVPEYVHAGADNNGHTQIDTGLTATAEELFCVMVTYLAGQPACKLAFPDRVLSGDRNDLRAATSLVTKMVRELGQSSLLGEKAGIRPPYWMERPYVYAYQRDAEAGRLSTRAVNEEDEALFISEVLDTFQGTARNLVATYAPAVHAVAGELQKSLFLGRDALASVLSVEVFPPPAPNSKMGSRRPDLLQR